MGIDSRVHRAVFLDRDGVINRAFVRNGIPHPPCGADAVEVLPGVAFALQRLKAAGYLRIVVTNQPDVARGTQSRAAVETIHERLASELSIDDFRICYHDDVDRCECRKPKPGLIVEAARAYGVDLGASVMVGDRWRDIEAGRRAGCRTIFVDHGYAERKPQAPDLIVRSLEEATSWILSVRPQEHR